MEGILQIAIGLIILSFVAIIGGIIQLIITKGKDGLKYVIGGIVTIVVLLVIGFGTCVMALNS
jgi:hypothetical protein